MDVVVTWGVVVFVGSTAADTAACSISGTGHPDLSLVDALARMQLAATRSGRAIRLQDMSPELGELLDLLGLRVEVGGQPEGREQVGGVEEGVETRDPTT